jgi:GR25 family glycosyltransferase involved in LPS biosynthesis
MTEIKLSRFFKTGEFSDCVSILEELLINKEFYTGLELSKWFLNYFPNNFELSLFIGLFQFNTGDYVNCFTTLNNVKNSDFDIAKIKIITKKQCDCIPFLKNQWIFYNKEIVDSITERKNPMITFTITTCKRFDLFEKTMNSFLNCCLDLNLIDKWILIDDNSSEEDREKMKSLYPFFTFFFKSNSEKGHAKSMNMILKETESPFIFHMEDDWQFFFKDNYISKCLEVLNTSDNIGQCLINKNYAETEKDWIILGGTPSFTSSKKLFFIHDHQADINLFYNKYGQGPNCAYWKHFSFRPSLIKKSVLTEIGLFNPEANHFEAEYAERYNSKKFVSAFLPGIYSLHIGRLTSEINDKEKKNAYDLNNEIQFEEKKGGQITIKIKTFVVNLDRRPDRWETFLAKNQKTLDFLEFKRYSAVDGLKLTTNKFLHRIFEGNDYNMRTGIVGCALTHIKLYIDLVYSEDDIYIIFEDDIEISKDFKKEFFYILKAINDWDICFLAHSSKNKFKDGPNRHLIKLNTKDSLQVSYGGTFAYMISKKGALKLLSFINKVGMTNAIDTMQQLSADFLDVYYCFPNFASTDCILNNQSTDSDIQRETKSLTYTGDTSNLHSEIPNRLMVGNKFNIENAIIYN